MIDAVKLVDIKKLSLDADNVTRQLRFVATKTTEITADRILDVAKRNYSKDFPGRKKEWIEEAKSSIKRFETESSPERVSVPLGFDYGGDEGKKIRVRTIEEGSGTRGPNMEHIYKGDYGRIVWLHDLGGTHPSNYHWATWRKRKQSPKYQGFLKSYGKGSRHTMQEVYGRDAIKVYYRMPDQAGLRIFSRTLGINKSGAIDDAQFNSIRKFANSILEQYRQKIIFKLSV